MATQNFFELLGDEETDASAVIERAAAMEKVKKQRQQKQQQQQQHQHPQQQQTQDPPKPPSSKPLPPAHAVMEAKASRDDSGKSRGGRGRGRGGFGNRDREYDGGSYFPSLEGGAQANRGFDRSEGYRHDGTGFQGGRGHFYGQGRAALVPVQDEGGQNFKTGRGRGRFGRNQGRGFRVNADYYRDSGASQEQQQGVYVRKDAAGVVQGTDVIVEPEGGVVIVAEEENQNVLDKQRVEEAKVVFETVEEKKEDKEDNEMLLDDYYKVLDEKNKHLKSLRAEERKVVVDKDFEKMVIVEKKQDEGDFVKVGYDKDKGKKEERANKDDKPRKNVSINEFLKPMEGAEYYIRAGRRGRGRGRGVNERGEGYRVGFGGSYNATQKNSAPRIEDPGQFPVLGAK